MNTKQLIMQESDIPAAANCLKAMIEKDLRIMYYKSNSFQSYYLGDKIVNEARLPARIVKFLQAEGYLQADGAVTRDGNQRTFWRITPKGERWAQTALTEGPPPAEEPKERSVAKVSPEQMIQALSTEVQKLNKENEMLVTKLITAEKEYKALESQILPNKLTKRILEIFNNSELTEADAISILQYGTMEFGDDMKKEAAELQARASRAMALANTFEQLLKEKDDQTDEST